MLPWLLWNVYCATDTGMKSDDLHQVRAMREEWGEVLVEGKVIFRTAAP